jgi:hypothetical protein
MDSPYNFYSAAKTKFYLCHHFNFIGFIQEHYFVVVDKEDNFEFV